MQKFLVLVLLSVFFIHASGQKVGSKLQFEQGKKLQVQVEVKNTVSQQGGGQAIDFTVSGTAFHNYAVTNSTDENTTLHHDVERIRFNFNGMGQKRSFDSDNPKDISGPWGAPVAEMLTKSYDIIIDTVGQTLLSNPDKIELKQTDDRFSLVANMLRDLVGIIYPPQKGNNSFFKVLPGYPVGVGDVWNESSATADEKVNTSYSLTAITDSTIIVDFRTTSTITSSTQLMGMPVSSIMNNTAFGKVILDRRTGLIKEKSSNIESTGTTEAMGNTTPMTAKTTIVITVVSAEH